MKGRKPSTIAISSASFEKVPRPPAWLSKEAKSEWRRVMPELVDRRILTETDLAMVEAFCVAAGRVREIEREIQASGCIDPSLVRMQDKAMQTMRQIAAEIGATPVSRSRPAIRDDDASGDISVLDI